MSIVYLQANNQAESENKVIMKVLKKKLGNAKGLWMELLNEILWSYHTVPHSTATETLFAMVYREDDMLHVEIDIPSWRQSQFNEEANKIGLKCAAGLIDELRETTHIREFSTKHRNARRYNSRVKPR